VLCLVIATPQKNRTNVNGGTPGWKEAINELTMYYGDGIPQLVKIPHPRNF